MRLIRKIVAIIKDIDREINIFAQKFDREKKDFDTLTSNLSFICNERTMSFFTNERINKNLSANGFPVVLYVNEFAIEFKNGLDQTSFNIIKSEVEKSKKTKPWNKCFVDGYFKVENLMPNDDITHLFVEYKMDNSFVYLELANDFLKYKAITYKNESNTAFVYVIFDKKELYPTILSQHPHLAFLRKKIKSKTITGTKKVYIYLPIFKAIQNEKKPMVELYSTVKKLNSASNLAEKIDELRKKVQNGISKNDMLFVDSMKLFNSRVVKSMTLRKYYSFIKQLWDKCNDAKMFDNLELIFEGCAMPLEPNTIIKEGATYKENLSDYITAEDRKEVLKNGFHPILNVSLFIIAFLDFFNEYFNIGVQSPKYDKIKIGRKESNKADLTETVSEFKEKLKNHYSSFNNSENRIKKLAYSLMYYLTNLFSIIYKINDNLVVEDYNDDFEYFLVQERLQNSIDDIRKSIKFKDKIIVEEILDCEETESRENFLKLINVIMNKYM